MLGSTAQRPRKKRAGQYHHGDLRQALVGEALRTIDRSGVDALTLRGVGDALGVSRTALYRHFSDKQALVAAVAREGFRVFRLALLEAWSGNGGGPAGFQAMGEAYLRFALAHPSHYRVMFGRFVESSRRDPELEQEAHGAFQALVDAVTELQQAGHVRKDDPLMLALFVWSTTHGIATLAIDGQLRGSEAEVNRYVSGRLWDGIQAPP